MDTRKLSEGQQQMVLAKVAPHVEKVVKTGAPEDEKLKAIGRLVEWEITNILAPKLYKKKEAEPSIPTE